MSSLREDDIERSLLEVKSRIESVVTMRRDRSSQEQLITPVDGYGAALDAARTLINEATTSINIVHARRPSDVERAGWPEDAEAGLLPTGLPGVTARLLTAPTLVDEDFVRQQLVSGNPVAVRVARMPPQQILVVDGRVGLVVLGSGAGLRSSVIRVPELLHSVQALFRSVWSVARPVGGRHLFASRNQAEAARRVLTALHSGLTDDVAARGLNISVRTYRGHVAEIMAQLGATSRFQAGVRAAELGLLRPKAVVHRGWPADVSPKPPVGKATWSPSNWPRTPGRENEPSA